ncbi:GNAT family N-acetyltransferase [Paenibacillus sp. HJGM_3]|uniref:GNAT family N-acetyltransferase n=1 Tax=Paenibacillus sp. HJGM_3 TaxID=3379816 RepID=UPI00385BFDDB
MIRRRIPVRDDRMILQLIRSELLPYTNRTFPGMTIDRHILQERLSGLTTYVCSRNGLHTVGFVSCLTEDGTLHIDMIAIDRKAQGKGYGSALMGAAERFGLRRGCQESVLYVDQQNRGAQRFYRRKGYALVSYLEGLQCYEMRKPLRSLS